MLSYSKAFCHLALKHRTKRSNHLIEGWILMQHAPQRDVVLRCRHHALTDDGLALLLVVIVTNDVEHTVQEHHRRSHFPYGFQYLSPSLVSINRVPQSENLELLLWLCVVKSCQLTHAVLDSDRVILSLFCVDVQHNRKWYLFM